MDDEGHLIHGGQRAITKTHILALVSYKFKVKLPFQNKKIH